MDTTINPNYAIEITKLAFLLHNSCKVIKHLQKSRTELFSEFDAPYLNPLSQNSYVYKQFKIARVNQDYHITLEKCNYSVPAKNGANRTPMTVSFGQ